MPKRSPLKSAEFALRKAALKYPQATEDFPWGHRSFKIKGKLFLIIGGDKTTMTVTAKLPVTGRQALSLPFAKPTGYGLGKSGWVTASFTAKDAIPIELLEDWMDESYRAIAPKKLVQKLNSKVED